MDLHHPKAVIGNDEAVEPDVTPKDKLQDPVPRWHRKTRRSPQQDDTCLLVVSQGEPAEQNEPVKLKEKDPDAMGGTYEANEPVAGAAGECEGRCSGLRRGACDLPYRHASASPLRGIGRRRERAEHHRGPVCHLRVPVREYAVAATPTRTTTRSCRLMRVPVRVYSEVDPRRGMGRELPSGSTSTIASSACTRAPTCERARTAFV